MLKALVFLCFIRSSQGIYIPTWTLLDHLYIQFFFLFLVLKWHIYTSHKLLNLQEEI